MKRRRHTPEQIVRKLREGERLLNEGKDLTEVLRHLEVTESTWGGTVASWVGAPSRPDAGGRRCWGARLEG